MSRHEKTKYPGIYRKHARACTVRASNGAATCGCPYEATIYLARECKLLRKHFRTLGEARSWRSDAHVAARSGLLKSPSKTTLREKSAELIAGMEDGSIFDRTGRTYKPSTRRGYERVMRLHVLPRLGHLRLSALERRDVQALVEELHAEGKSASTIQNVLNPLQVICRRAMHNNDITVDPTVGLNLPANRGKRDRIAAPDVARRLIEALPEAERAFWATAFWAGLRRGELRALRWEHVDFDAGVIRVERGWDDEEGEIEVKSDAGRRVVPLAGSLRGELRAHKLRSGRSAADLVFGRTAREPFIPTTVRSRALRAWDAANAKAEEALGRDLRDGERLEPLTPHDARHCAASYLIAAGLNAKELSVYIGHSDIRTTYNRYGHLMPGGEVEAAAKLTAFLDGDVATG